MAPPAGPAWGPTSETARKLFRALGRDVPPPPAGRRCPWAPRDNNDDSGYGRYVVAYGRYLRALRQANNEGFK